MEEAGFITLMWLRLSGVSSALHLSAKPSKKCWINQIHTLFLQNRSEQRDSSECDTCAGSLLPKNLPHKQSRGSVGPWGRVVLYLEQTTLQGAAASAALLTSAVLILCFSCLTYTTVTQRSTDGAPPGPEDWRNIPWFLETLCFSVYAAELRFWKECCFRPMTDILWLVSYPPPTCLSSSKLFTTHLLVSMVCFEGQRTSWGSHWLHKA